MTQGRRQGKTYTMALEVARLLAQGNTVLLVDSRSPPQHIIGVTLNPERPMLGHSPLEQIAMTITCPLVGSHFHPPAKQVLQLLSSGIELALRAEPGNAYDPKAIQVFVALRDVLALSGETLAEALSGTGWDVEDLAKAHEANDEADMVLGHVGKTGGKPCLQAGLPGTEELWLACGQDPEALNEAQATLLFDGGNGQPRVEVEL